MPLSVRVCGALNGSVTLDAGDNAETVTLGHLRAEVTRLLQPASLAANADGGGGGGGVGGFGGGAKLILAGRVLAPADDAVPLSHVRGFGPASRVLVSRAPPSPASAPVANGAAAAPLPPAARQLAAEEERAARLERLRACAARMAARDGRRTGGYALELENQDGSRLQLDPGERAALATALALHAAGRATLRDAERALRGAAGGGGEVDLSVPSAATAVAASGTALAAAAPASVAARALFARALDELLLADEAFALAPPRLVEATDNRPLLQLDAAWAALRLRDASRLGVWLSRLEQARDGLRRAHGERGERASALLGAGAGGPRGGGASEGASAAAAVRCRLEVLTAAALFHAHGLGGGNGGGGNGGGNGGGGSGSPAAAAAAAAAAANPPPPQPPQPQQQQQQQQQLEARAQVYRHLAEARAILDRLASLAPDGAVAAVAGAMACEPRAAARALRRCGGDASAAVDMLQRADERGRARQDERRRRSAWRRERRRYGRTPGGEYVDAVALERLLAVGGGGEAGGGAASGGEGSGGGAWSRAEAAEALRAAGNDAERALAALTSPASREALQMAVVARQAAAAGRSAAAGRGGRRAPSDGEEEEDEEADEEAEGELAAALRRRGGGAGAGEGDDDEAYDLDQEGALAEVLATYEALLASAAAA